MKASRIQSILIHIAATMLLSIGFVKTADRIDPMEAEFSTSGQVDTEDCLLGTLPCGSNLK